MSAESKCIIVSVWPGRTAEDVVGWMLWGLAAAYCYRTESRRLLSALVVAAAAEAWPQLDFDRASTDTEAVHAVIAVLATSGCLRAEP